MNNNCLISRSLLFILFLVCSCRRVETPQPEQGKTGAFKNLSEKQWRDEFLNDPKLSGEQKAMMLSQIPTLVAEDKQEILDRKELVLPPPVKWKPVAVGRRLKLTLIPEKTIIRKGEKFRYRLEVQNVGREAIVLIEMPYSFIKTGIENGPYEFYLLTSEGKETRLPAPFSFGGSLSFTEYHFPKNWTEGQKRDEFEMIKAAGQANAHLSLTLNPGETIVSRPGNPGSNLFRDLRTDLDFNRRGTYRLRLVYEDRPSSPPTENEIQSGIKFGLSRERQIQSYQKSLPLHLGRLESNTVKFEVVP